MSETPLQAAEGSTARPDRLPWSQMVLYGLPGSTVGFMGSVLSLYVMKFSTDVLLIAPAVMGTIFGLSRIWDAVTDPLVGYLSDRTTLRFGRRRAWILGGTLPAGVAYLMLFSSPADASPGVAAIWMAVAIFSFYTAMTTIAVPHLSWGAEFTQNYNERNRLFGVRHSLTIMGSVVGIVCVGWLSNVETSSPEDLRPLAQSIAGYVAVALAVLVAILVLNLQEQSDSKTFPRGGVYGAARDVWHNPHARILITVTFIEHIGSAAIGASALYVAQYVVGAVAIAPYAIVTYFLMSSISVPVWVRLSYRFGKIRLWFASLLGTALIFGAMFSLAFIDSQQLPIVVLLVLCVLAGAAAGCGGTIGPSIQSDVIDYDELQTGERKEGAYFAVWNFAQKSAGGITLMITGFVLSLAGFIPNVEQTRTVEIALAGLLGIFPLICCAIGAALFTRFRLDEAAHREIMTQLRQKRA